MAESLMNSFGSYDVYRSTLITNLNLACTRAREARLQAIKVAFSALELIADVSHLTMVERTVARVDTEDQRRIRISCFETLRLELHCRTD